MIAPDVSPTGTLETPAMRGKRYRSDELGERTVIARNWRYHAFAVDLLLLIALCIIGYLVQLPRNIPVYVERDADTGAMRVLATSERGYKVSQETIKRELREFVEVIRRVSPDKDGMQRQWKAVFHKVTPRGFEVLSNYASAMNPLRVKGEIRVEILRILAQTDRTYDLRWTETVYNDYGVKEETATYSGIFTWVPREGSKAVSLEELAANPAGIYLDSWQWSKE